MINRNPDTGVETLEPIMIGNLVIDAALTEEHTNEADVSEFPVEDGSNFTDNVRIKPRKYRMSGIVTDTPLDLGFRSIEDDGVPIVDTSTPAAAQAKVALESLFLTGQPLTVVSMLATYKNMTMKDLVFAQDGDTGASLPFTCSFTQITVVANVRRAISVKFTALDLGNRTGHPPGWIGTDKLGRDIVASKAGPGLEPTYTRADGTTVTNEEAAAANRKQGANLIKYDKDGNAIPVDPADYQPNTPRQKKPFWSPPDSARDPVLAPLPGFPGV